MTTPTRFCPNCGEQVNPGERFCANCGTRMPEAPSAPPPAASSAGEPIQMLGQRPPSPVQQPAAGAEAFTVPSGANEPPKRSGCPIWLIVILSVLGLCVIMAGAGIFALTMFGQRVVTEMESGLATIQVDPTLMAALEEVATPDALTTPEPLPTLGALPTIASAATIDPAATPGRSGSAAAVQTSIAATVEAALGVGEELVATAEAELIFASAREIFRDEFVDNRNNWFTGVFREIERNTLEDGVFKVSWFADGFSYELYEVRTLTNFIAEVDCLVVQGGPDGSCGLIFGQNNDVGFYEFEAFEDYYRITVYAADAEPRLLLEGDPAGIITPGEPFRLQIIRRGDELRAAINGVLLGTVNDATFPTGRIGLSTNSYLEEGGVEIWFDNVAIWELP
jgi:hypothetical protein